MKKTFMATARHILALITTFFLSGLFALLPLALTISLFYFTWKFVSGITAPLRDTIVPSFLQTLPYSEVIFVIGIIIGFGALLRFVLAQSFVHSIEKRLISRIPLVEPIYSGIKQLTSALSMQDKDSFKHVVLVEFPRKGIYSIGFLSSDFPAELAPDKTTKFYNVFIPATPNPLHGSYVICSEAEVIITQLSRQEAMSMIMSGGIIQPERYQQK